MLNVVARWVIVGPKRVIGVALLVMAVAAVLGAPVSTMLSAGGFTDPDAESNRANAILIDEFGQGFVPLYLLVKAPGAVSDSAPRAVVDALVTELRRAEQVANVTSPWEVPDPIAAGLVSRDGNPRWWLPVSMATKQQDFAFSGVGQAVRRRSWFRHQRLGGRARVIFAQIAEQSDTDLMLSEAIVLPISFAVLVWVFGGLIAALIPLAVGGLLSLADGHTAGAGRGHGALVFAQNLAVAMGLALAIDYSLLLVKSLSRRSRQWLRSANRHPTHTANCRSHRRVLRCNGRAMPGHDGHLPDVLPDIVCLRRCFGGGARGSRRAAGGARGDHDRPGDASARRDAVAGRLTAAGTRGLWR